jgi:hypothetical protein
MSNKTTITELDFFEIKDQLKAFMKGQSKFLDYDFEGSNMSVLLDILSYNTFQNNFYTNMAFSEMFLDSAQLRDSVISHAKELNYLPKSIQSSKATLFIDFVNVSEVTGEGNLLPSYLKIPKFTKFTGRKSGEAFNFVTLKDYTVFPDVNDKYCLTGIEVFEGKLVQEEYTVTSDDKQKFVLSNENVDTSTIEVHVRENTNVSAKKEEFIKKDGIFGVKKADKVYYIKPTKGNRFEIEFGRDVFGEQPLAGSVIEVSYLVSKGAESNGIQAFSGSSISFDGNSYDISITTVSKATGGSAEESIESIRRFAPKSIQIQDRAITESDYEILLRNQFPQIQTVAVYGGEELDPPRFGRVIVSVDVNNAEGSSENDKIAFANYLKERSPLSIEPIVVSPEFMHVNVKSTIYLNVDKTEKSPNAVRSDIITSILNYSDTSLNEFAKTMRYSKLLSAIDSADTNIISNDTKVRAIIEFVPSTTASNYTINFKNELVKDSLTTTNSLEYTPALYSSVFTHDDDQGFIQDNGNGVLRIVKTATDGSFIILHQNVGTIDYTTGKINIVNLAVPSYTGSALKFFANVKSSDIKAPKERIISIRSSDVDITVIGTKDV